MCTWVGRNVMKLVSPTRKTEAVKEKRAPQSLHSTAMNITHWDGALLVECLPSLQKVLGLIPQDHTN